MAKDNTGISSLDTGASDITYSGDEGPKSPDQELMAQADPMLVEEYKKYVFEMEEMGLTPMTFEEFTAQARAGMYAGGQSTPSDYTMEDARMMTTQDKLGGITDVMKQADLNRQGSVGQMYMADGGRIGYADGTEWTADAGRFGEDPAFSKLVDDAIIREENKYIRKGKIPSPFLGEKLRIQIELLINNQDELIQINWDSVESLLKAQNGLATKVTVSK